MIYFPNLSVLATQNPIDQEGTYPLPTQLDRFLMNINISYPDLASEEKILLLASTDDAIFPKNVLTFKEVLEFQKLIKEIPVGKSIIQYILSIISAIRPETSKIKSVKENILWGPSPRASISLLAASKAKLLYKIDIHHQN